MKNRPNWWPINELAAKMPFAWQAKSQFRMRSDGDNWQAMARGVLERGNAVEPWILSATEPSQVNPRRYLVRFSRFFRLFRMS